MSNLPNCPQFGSEYTYEDRGMLVYPEFRNFKAPELDAPERLRKYLNIDDS